MKNDEGLNTLFRDAADGASPDFAVHRVVAGAATRGRAKQRRRRTLNVVGGLAAVAVVAPLAWVGVGQLNTGTAPAPGTSVVGAEPTDASAPAGPQRIAFSQETIGAEVLAAAQELRPGAGVTVTDPLPGFNRLGRVGVAEVRDGDTSGYLEVRLWPADGTMEEVSEGVCNPINDTGPCRSVAGGTMASQTAPPNAESPGIVWHTATFVRPDGIRVVASSSNTELAAWPAPIMGSQAPFDLADLEAIASSDRWVEAGEPEAKPTQDVPLGVPALDAAGMQAELIGQLEALVPGATVSPAAAAQGAGPRAGAVVDDGDGVAYVDLYVGAPMPDFVYGDYIAESGVCSAGCSETAAGRLETYDGADDGKDNEVGVWNGANFIRVDGVEVLVSISNTAGPKYDATATTRATPPLSGADLSSLVTSDVWVQ